MRRLVNCVDHLMAHPCLVCVHIAKGMAKKYVRIEPRPGEQADYVCSECWARMQTNPSSFRVDEFMTACIHCARDAVTGIEAA